MAKITFKSGDDYMRRLQKLADRSEAIIKKAVYEGAHIVADEIRENLETRLAGSSESTGDLAASLFITPIARDEDGVINAKIGFDGYDSKGVPNQLKARVLESGSSTVQKRPFVRPAINAKRKDVLAAMDKVVEDEVKKTMEQ